MVRGKSFGGLSGRRQSLWSVAPCMSWGLPHLLQPCPAAAEKAAKTLKKGKPRVERAFMGTTPWGAFRWMSGGRRLFSVLCCLSLG